MPVNTGMTADEDAATDVLIEVEDESKGAPPPGTVAGLDAIDNEPAADEIRKIKVRDREFTLRSSLPGMLLMRLTKKQMELSKPGAVNDPMKQAEALSATGDMISKLVVEAEREDFIDYLEDVDPPVEVTELMKLMQEMTERVTGRPTQSA